MKSEIRSKIIQALQSPKYSKKKIGLQTEINKKQRIHNVFQVLLLEQNTTKKEQLDKTMLPVEFDNSKNKSREYKVKAIRDSRVYIRDSENHLLGLYYLISCKTYLKKKNTRKPSLAFNTFENFSISTKTSTWRNRQ